MNNEKIIKLYKGQIEILFKIDEHSYWTISTTKLKKDGTGAKVRIPGTTTIIDACLDKSRALLSWQAGLMIDYLRENQEALMLEPEMVMASARTKADEKKKDSADLGTEIHEWIEHYIKGENPEMPSRDDVLIGVNAFLEWESQTKVKLVEAERLVFNKELFVCGQADIIATIGKQKYLLDIKTGNGIYESYLMQTANYVKSIEMEDNGKAKYKRIILRVSKETEEEYKIRMMKKEYYQKNPEKLPEYKVFEAVYLDAEVNTVDEDYEAFKGAVSIYNWLKGAKKRLGY